MERELGYEQVREAAKGTALRIGAALGGGGRAAGFILRYTEQNRREALTAHMPRYRELIAMIDRECLLAMVARVEMDLPRRLHVAERPARTIADEEDPLLRRFRISFYEQLAALLEWGREDLDRFWGNLDLYMQCMRAAGARRGGKKGELGPFADRCGFMLDPAMLNRARRAAARFHIHLEATARKILRAAFRAGMEAGEQQVIGPSRGARGRPRE
jgi:hypothetical protein